MSEYECRDCGEVFDASEANYESHADEIGCPGCHSTEIIEHEPADDAPAEQIIEFEYSGDDLPF